MTTQEKQFMTDSIFKKIERTNTEMTDLISRKAEGIEFANEENWDITNAHILNCIDELVTYKSMLSDLLN